MGRRDPKHKADSNYLNYISNDYYNHTVEGRKKELSQSTYNFWLNTLSLGNDGVVRGKLQTNPNSS